MKNHYLEIEAGELEASNSYWTAREICQQPAVWRKAYNAIDNAKVSIDSWLAPVLARSDMRIILSGAGTSAFIGETLAPWLRKRLNRRVDAVSNTDLVSDPEQYLAEDFPTLMISFARSGDSPESVASVDLANRFLGECHHLLLTCNPKGQLAKSALNHNNMLCLLMPEETNDRGFAMTSSYSSMLVSCASIFTPDLRQLELSANLAKHVIDNHACIISVLAQQDFNRVVFLGAGCLLGTAREAALKCLELSAGKVMPMFDTPLGFRHGPKSVVDKTTLIFHLQSVDPYIAHYDRDLHDELMRDYQAEQLIALSPVTLGAGSDGIEDLWLSLPYIVYCQIFAFFKALALQIAADNPCPSGEVNRVVKGVRIHSYPGRKKGSASKIGKAS